MSGVNTGEKYRHWSVLEKNVGDSARCRCDCGKEKNVKIRNLKYGSSLRCSACSDHRKGLKSREEKSRQLWEGRSSEFSGKRFGKLEVVGPFLKTQSGQMRASCRCDCGSETQKTFSELSSKKERSVPLSCGCIRPAQDKSVARKISQTKKERREVHRDRLLNKYGVDSVQKVPEIKDKTLSSLQERFGTEHFSKHPSVKEKRRRTSLERYGAVTSLLNPEIQAKAQQTWVERYGVDNPFKSPEVQSQIGETLADNGWSSSGETDLKNWIESELGLQCKKAFVGGVSPFEIDIWIPEKSIAIEFNGCFWHSESGSGDKKKHLEKTKRVKEEKNAELIHIFDVDWLRNQEAVRSYLRARLTALQKKRASKMNIRISSLSEVDHLLKNHLQGSVRSADLVVVLEEEGQIQMAGVFCRPHRANMDRRLHLSRVVSAPGIRVMGGLSRIARFAFSEIGEFVSFVDLSISSGASYRSAGFIEEKTLDPDYFYYSGKEKKRISKQSRQKRRVGTPDGMTEYEHALRDGLHRVWDCGKIKFKFCGA